LLWRKWKKERGNEWNTGKGADEARGISTVADEAGGTGTVADEGGGTGTSAE
jgi:hypothetical protein